MFSKLVLSGLFATVLIAFGNYARGSKLELTLPVLSAAEILDIAEDYYKKIANKSSREYELVALRFDYVSGNWVVSYVCAMEKFPPGCHYGLIISNTAEPEITHMPGK